MFITKKGFHNFHFSLSRLTREGFVEEIISHEASVAIFIHFVRMFQVMQI
jgi:hypothetical protein